MFVDLGILPVDASSCGSRTSNSCISPSVSISFKQSNWTSPGTPFEQFQNRSRGPALAESALATTKRGTALCDKANLVNFPTCRRVIADRKCFKCFFFIFWGYSATVCSSDRSDCIYLHLLTFLGEVTS